MTVKGELLKIYLLAYALFRFAVEFVRGNLEVWAGLSRSQLFLIPTTLLLLAYFWRQWRRDIYRIPSLDGSAPQRARMTPQPGCPLGEGGVKAVPAGRRR